MMMLNDRRDPELSGTYRFRWHHCPSKGECGPAYKLVPPDFDAEKCVVASSERNKKKKKKKAKKKRPPSNSETYSDLELAVTNEPHSEEYLSILAQREESRKARERERAQGLEALPPITDDASAAMRRHFLEDQERKDYALKERELDEDNAEKLRKYKATLARRQERVEERRKSQEKERSVGMRNAPEQKDTELEFEVDTESKAAVEGNNSEPKRTVIPCTCSRTCNTTQRSPKPNGKNGTVSTKNNRAQQQLALDIELLERKFEEEDNRKKSDGK